MGINRKIIKETTSYTTTPILRSIIKHHQGSSLLSTKQDYNVINNIPSISNTKKVYSKRKTLTSLLSSTNNNNNNNNEQEQQEEIQSYDKLSLNELQTILRAC